MNLFKKLKNNKGSALVTVVVIVVIVSLMGSAIIGITMNEFAMSAYQSELRRLDNALETTVNKVMANIDSEVSGIQDSVISNVNDGIQELIINYPNIYRKLDGSLYDSVINRKFWDSYKGVSTYTVSGVQGSSFKTLYESNIKNKLAVPTDNLIKRNNWIDMGTQSSAVNNILINYSKNYNCDLVTLNAGGTAITNPVTLVSDDNSNSIIRLTSASSQAISSGGDYYLLTLTFDAQLYGMDRYGMPKNSKIKRSLAVDLKVYTDPTERLLPYTRIYNTEREDTVAGAKIEKTDETAIPDMFRRKNAIVAQKNIVFMGKSGILANININGDLNSFGTIPSASDGGEDLSAGWDEYGGIMFGMNSKMRAGLSGNFSINPPSTFDVTDGLVNANIAGDVSTLGYLNILHSNDTSDATRSKVTITGNSYVRSLILADSTTGTGVRDGADGARAVFNGNLLTMDDIKINSNNAIVSVKKEYAGFTTNLSDLNGGTSVGFTNSRHELKSAKSSSSVVVNGDSQIKFFDKVYIGGAIFYNGYNTGISATKAKRTLFDAFEIIDPNKFYIKPDGHKFFGDRFNDAVGATVDSSVNVVSSAVASNYSYSWNKTTTTGTEKWINTIYGTAKCSTANRVLLHDLGQPVCEVGVVFRQNKIDSNALILGANSDGTGGYEIYRSSTGYIIRDRTPSKVPIGCWGTVPVSGGINNIIGYTYDSNDRIKCIIKVDPLNSSRKQLDFYVNGDKKVTFSGLNITGTYFGIGILGDTSGDFGDFYVMTPYTTISGASTYLDADNNIIGYNNNGTIVKDENFNVKKRAEHLLGKWETEWWSSDDIKDIFNNILINILKGANSLNGYVNGSVLASRMDASVSHPEGVETGDIYLFDSSSSSVDGSSSSAAQTIFENNVRSKWIPEYASKMSNFIVNSKKYDVTNKKYYNILNQIIPDKGIIDYVDKAVTAGYRETIASIPSGVYTFNSAKDGLSGTFYHGTGGSKEIYKSGAVWKVKNISPATDEGTISDKGIIFVEGDLYIDDGFIFNGIIVSTGNVVVNGSITLTREYQGSADIVTRMIGDNKDIQGDVNIRKFFKLFVQDIYVDPTPADTIKILTIKSERLNKRNIHITRWSET